MHPSSATPPSPAPLWVDPDFGALHAIPDEPGLLELRLCGPGGSNRIGPAFIDDAGVGAKQIDRAEARFSLFNQPPDGRFA